MKTQNATVTLIKAVPTTDVNGNVVKWEADVEYAFDDYTVQFGDGIEQSTTTEDMEGNKTVTENFPEKPPTQFSKQEIINLLPTAHYGTVFESMYCSTHDTTDSGECCHDDFTVDDLK